MATLIYNVGKDRFGEVDKILMGNKAEPNRREKNISELRSDLIKLKKRYKKAAEFEKPALSELRDILRNQLKSLRRAERHRRRRKERARRRAQFVTNPHHAVSKLSGAKRSGRLQCPKAEVEEHLKITHSDPLRNLPMENEKLVKPEMPTVSFNMKEIKLQEIQDVIKKARGGSAPGPDTIPYKVYKKCPKLVDGCGS